MTVRSFGILFTLSLLTGCNSAGLLVINLLAGLDNYHVYENLSYGSEKQNVMDVYVPETEKMSGQPDRQTMIVTDTNTIAYLFINSEKSTQAEQFMTLLVNVQFNQLKQN